MELLHLGFEVLLLPVLALVGRVYPFLQSVPLDSFLPQIFNRMGDRAEFGRICVCHMRDIQLTLRNAFDAACEFGKRLGNRASDDIAPRPDSGQGSNQEAACGKEPAEKGRVYIIDVDAGADQAADLGYGLRITELWRNRAARALFEQKADESGSSRALGRFNKLLDELDAICVG